MQILRMIGFAAAIAILFGCSTSEDSPLVQEKATARTKAEVVQPAISTADGHRSITRGGATREYLLHVPASHDQSVAMPLVINFHGFGGNAAAFSREVGALYGLNTVADNQGFLVAYPQAIVREKGAAYWDPGDDGSLDINRSDIYLVEQLIDEISGEYSTDRSRVYAAGYSNGGMMAYGLVCSRADLIAAAGIMSGIMLDGTCSSDDSTSIIVFHGTADGVLPYDGNQDFRAVPEVVGFWVDHNGIPEAEPVTISLNDGNVTRHAYTGGRGGAAVVLYTINREYGKPGGHVWFSDEIDGATPNQLLWDFLFRFQSQ